MDGTKLPVKPCVRKKLRHILTKQPTDVVTSTKTTTNSNVPLVMVFYFEEEDIPNDPRRPHVPKIINEDTTNNLDKPHNLPSDKQSLNKQPLGEQSLNRQPSGERSLNDQQLGAESLNDQALNNQALNNQMETMALINDSPPLTTNQQIINDRSPFKENKLLNTFKPSVSDYQINVDKPPFRNDCPIPNLPSSSTDVVINITAKQDTLFDDDDDLEDDYMRELKKQNETTMQNYDERIDRFENNLERICHELEQVQHNLHQLKTEKQQKKEEFLNLLNEHRRLLKAKNSRILHIKQLHIITQDNTPTILHHDLCNDENIFHNYFQQTIKISFYNYKK
ncbi:unnamed protein product [Rotaria sp. Silwood2]|nr:unnamed protein product [Rotaria sp. Silwood2]